MITLFTALLLVLGLSAPEVRTASAAGGALGRMTGFTVDGNTVTFTSGEAKVRVIFYADDVFRIWAAPDGHFTDPNDDPANPNAADMVVKHDYPGVNPRVSRTGSGVRLATGAVVLTVGRDPMLFAARRPDGTPVFAETAPLSWSDTATTQTLSTRPGEQFFGGGEQNGGFVHTGRTIQVANDFDWDEGGHPNSQPFYLSTAGYGVFRNTFAPGQYAFTDPVRTTESERRFDGYYFIGTPKQVIGDYTALVGRPFMPPMYGLEMGDSDCYLHNANRGERHTLDAIDVADGYVSRDIPLGWMLVNDGYGCGYEDLAETGDRLRARNLELGLWTSTGLPNQAEEVKAGVRVRKLDVGWAGPGYRFALDGGQTALEGIESNSDARGFVWQPVSWAGSQRTSVLWSGDQSGGWDYIRWQIPTYAGSTMSGIAYNTGDVDGIFGGSPKTYVRDLEWKSFLPAVMTMDGWASSDKQPWRYGEPYTSIDKRYIQLRERLLPYFYTYAHEAHQTGVGMVRPLALEYPDDPNAFTDLAAHEFLSGTDFLVAPVYSDTGVRDAIYLPKGTWVDYWTGRLYEGPVTVNGYSAPLDRLPLFVRAGAAIPMWPEGTTDWADRDTGRLDLDIYPQGHGGFTLYEDDGRTRAYQNGAAATQTVGVSAPRRGRGGVTVNVGPSVGEYTGRPAARAYQLTVHTGSRPAQVLLRGAAGRPRLREYTSEAAYRAAGSGWYYDSGDRGGVVRVKTPPIGTGGAFALDLTGTTAVGGADPDTSSVQLGAPDRLGPGSATTLTATFRNGTAKPVHDVRMRLDTPAGVTATPVDGSPMSTVAAGGTATARFRLSVGAEPPASYALRASVAYRSGGNAREAGDPRPVTTVKPSLSLQVDRPAFEPGQTQEVTATFTNRATLPDVDARMDLTAPDGWTVRPVSPTTAGRLGAGAAASARWEVTAPDDVSAGRLTGEAHWSARGGKVTGDEQASADVLTLPDPGKAVLALDAGTAAGPVAPGYRRLSPDTAWDATAGYGWVGAAPQARDRGAPDDLRRDLLELPSTDTATLRLQVPAGRHTLYLLVGDQSYAAQSTEVSVDGKRILAQEDDLPPGRFQWSTAELDGGTGGRTVDLVFSAGQDWWKFNALLLGPAR
ncbi:NEW3 domain-containing protein [Actinoallomurus sp. NBC_01490]|uniref:TIM-barrel domain-containing protein n=1 Tax=Actinoallomurus sp. NBC_01490 TaxID=2903557 RepID=UPI002E3744CA|nr:TIM-barrel domain-containing protein [Actinoallomurus sp. NBC_01490]